MISLVPYWPGALPVSCGAEVQFQHTNKMKPNIQNAQNTQCTVSKHLFSIAPNALVRIGFKITNSGRVDKLHLSALAAPGPEEPLGFVGLPLCSHPVAAHAPDPPLDVHGELLAEVMLKWAFDLRLAFERLIDAVFK